MAHFLITTALYHKNFVFFNKAALGLVLLHIIHVVYEKIQILGGFNSVGVCTEKQCV